MKESGFPDFAMYTWSGLFARAETPGPIITKLYESFLAAMASPEGQSFLASAPIVVVNKDPTELQAFVVAEHNRFREIARAAGIKQQ